MPASKNICLNKIFLKKHFVLSKNYYTFASSDMSLVSGDVILLSVKF